MAPDLTHREPALRPDPTARRELPRNRSVPPGLEPPPIEALSVASARYVSGISVQTLTRRPLHFLLPVIAAVVVGVAVTLGGGLQYHCGATFRIAADASPARRAELQKDLLRFGWEQLGGGLDAEGTPWHVDSSAGGLLRLCITAGDRASGVEQASQIAQGFLASETESADAARQTPTDSEQILSQHAAELQQRTLDAEAQVDAAIASLPPADPREDREALLARWQGLRSDFSATRTQLTSAAAGLSRLQSEAEPTHGIVSTEERREALEADTALQQDLRELGVRLVELKLHLLTVWQESAGRLEQLRSTATTLTQTTAKYDTNQSPADVRGPVEQLAAYAIQYQEALATFAEAWTTEFTALQRYEVDSQHAEPLDAHQRSRQLLNDFLFHAASLLSSMRTQVNALAENPLDSARHHVLQSDLTRGFQTVQTAHHRFEFAAGNIETPDNFRLDASLRSARGLRRRSQERTRGIENRLESEATERARARRAQALAEVEQSLVAARSAADQTIDELFTLQEGLHRSGGLSEAFVSAVLRAELASEQLRTTRQDFTNLEHRLQELEAQRVSEYDTPRIELLSCGVIGSAVDWAQRCRVGAIGAVLTLLSMFAGQWVLLRPRKRAMRGT